MSGKWAIIGDDGEILGRPTEFPPCIVTGQRVSYKGFVMTPSISRRFQDKPVITIDQGLCHARATVSASLMSYQWNIEAWGDSVNTLIQMLNQIMDYAELRHKLTFK